MPFLRLALGLLLTCDTAVAEWMSLLNPPESSRSYSSVANDDPPGTGHAVTMLNSNGAGAWSAATSAVGESMTIDLGSEAMVNGVATQGRWCNADCGTGGCDQWVTSYNCKVTMNWCIRRIQYRELWSIFSRNVQFCIFLRGIYIYSLFFQTQNRRIRYKKTSSS